MNIYKSTRNYFEFLIFFILGIVLPKSKRITNSLLLINTGEIGDLIISSLLFENDKLFKDYSKVHFLIKEQYIELFNNYKGQIKFIGYNYNKYKYSITYKYKFLYMLRKKGFEKCINLTAARGILNEEITHLSGAVERITINSFTKYLGNLLGSYFNKKYTKILFSQVLNEYDKHVHFMKYLKSDLEIRLNDGNVFDNEKNEREFEKFKNSIVIAPFSSTGNRDWKIKYYKEIIYSLKLNNKIILLGSANQLKELENLADEDDESVIILAGKLSLYEIPLLLKKAKLFIGLDSGITHMALKIGCPLIAIIGGGEFGRFFPYMGSNKMRFLYYKMDCFLCHWECNKKEKYCITNITPTIVLNEIKSIFK